MKKTITALVAATMFSVAGSASAESCVITGNYDQQIGNLLNANNGYSFASYDLLCKRLEQANARLMINGMPGVLLGRSFGVIFIQVADINHPISIASTVQLNINVDADSNVANSNLYEAINIAAEETAGSIDSLIEELNEARDALGVSY